LHISIAFTLESHKSDPLFINSFKTALSSKLSEQSEQPTFYAIDCCVIHISAPSCYKYSW